MKYINLLFILLLTFCITASAQTDKGTPRDGEGVYAFLKRHNRNLTEHYEEFIQLNKGKFAKGNTLRKGVTYTLPPLSAKGVSSVAKAEEKSAVKRKYKLFGSKYEEYTIKSNKLKGACFYLSSGHGGPDPGAVGKIDGHEVHEDEYAYDITLRLARALMEEGATVHMIIQDAKDGIRDDRYLSNSYSETCMGEAIPRNQVKRLNQRSNKINSVAKKSKEKYKRAIFIHLDSRSQKQQLDVFFYYMKNSLGGKKLANTMRQTFDDHYKKFQPNRGFTGTVSMRSLHMLNKTTPVGIYAELGNIQNVFDQRRFLDYDNRQALANWMCRGFIKDYDNWKAGK